MDTIFGDSTPAPATLAKSVRIVFHTLDFPLKWTDCTHTADFLGQYFAGVLAEKRTAAQVTDLTHSIGYLANELIENAVKFRADGDVTIEAGLDEGDFILRVANNITGETSARFQPLLRELTDGDPGELLIARIEANAAEEGSGSGLGILTLMNDYGARLAWRFAPGADGLVFLETVARLTLPEETSTYAQSHHGN